ncbi:unnamed protein product, partial [Closterium sp. NIES-53]
PKSQVPARHMCPRAVHVVARRGPGAVGQWAVHAAHAQGGGAVHEGNRRCVGRTRANGEGEWRNGKKYMTRERWIDRRRKGGAD